jgi:hypothetical protein
LPKPLERAGVESLVRWIRRLDCYELSMGSLAETVAVMRGLCLSRAAAAYGDDAISYQ